MPTEITPFADRLRDLACRVAAAAAISARPGQTADLEAITAALRDLADLAGGIDSDDVRQADPDPRAGLVRLAVDMATYLDLTYADGEDDPMGRAFYSRLRLLVAALPVREATP